MTVAERRASALLASLFGLRMLGLFMVLPVFALAAQDLPGGTDPARIGLALGVYGFTQALLQIPLGLASDRFGRRVVVLAGLGLFVVGSLVSAFAQTVDGVIVGRALQGAGAVSAAITAWVADVTRDEVRARAMAMIGASAGLAFALSLWLAPLLVGLAGLRGLFWVMALLGALAMAVAAWVVPQPQTPPEAGLRAGQGPAVWRAMASHPQLLRLNLGIFSVHAAQMTGFVVLPVALAEAFALPASGLWRIYIPVLFGSFLLMLPLLFWAERRRAHHHALRLGALLMSAGCAAMAFALGSGWALALAFFVFFVAFNLLEALLPSAVSRLAPAHLKGAALGVFATTQSLGLFLGAVLGGFLVASAGAATAFWVAAGLLAVWMFTLLGFAPLPQRGGPVPS